MGKCLSPAESQSIQTAEVDTVGIPIPQVPHVIAKPERWPCGNTTSAHTRCQFLNSIMHVLSNEQEYLMYNTKSPLTDEHVRVVTP
jgi:hypothetical protein